MPYAVGVKRPCILALCLSGCTVTPPADPPECPPAGRGGVAATPDPSPAATSAPAPARFDARLTGYDYPYPVETRRFEAQEQPLEMAYMDVAPRGQANGETVLLLHGKNFSRPLRPTRRPSSRSSRGDREAPSSPPARRGMNLASEVQLDDEAVACIGDATGGVVDDEKAAMAVLIAARTSPRVAKQGSAGRAGPVARIIAA